MSWVRDHSEILKQITHFAIYPATYFIYIGLLLPLFVINWVYLYETIIKWVLE